MTISVTSGKSLVVLRTETEVMAKFLIGKMHFHVIVNVGVRAPPPFTLIHFTPIFGTVYDKTKTTCGCRDYFSDYLQSHHRP